MGCIRGGPMVAQYQESCTIATTMYQSVFFNHLNFNSAGRRNLVKRFDKVRKVIIVVSESKQSRRGRTTARFNTNESRRKIAPYVCFKINRSPTFRTVVVSLQINGFLEITLSDGSVF